MNWYFGVLRKYSQFEGRARRLEYWMFMFWHILILLALSLFATRWDSGIGAYLDVMYVVMVIIPSLAVTVRRLHDTGRSGWWVLLGLVPIVSFFLVVILCFRGERGSNAYGLDPLAQETSESG
jgi:uncharacterized membrane protein YhaH (DUF805 family)